MKVLDVPKLLSSLGIEAKQHHDEWLARCPGKKHADSNPSWSIKDDQADKLHGRHHCFSCKWGGTPVDLVMAVIGTSYSSAKAWVEREAMVDATAAAGVEIRVKSPTVRLFRQPTEVILRPWEEWVGPPKEYATRRGITPEQVQRWKIGYCLEGRLMGRLYFPVHDSGGRLLSYCARTFLDEVKGRVPRRYLAPKLQDGADMAAVWGERYWPPLEERDEVIVTEGTINGLAVERVTDTPVGALMGSELQLGQLLKIATFKRLTVLLDPDYAGDTAASKLANAFVRYGAVYRPKLRPSTDAASIPPEELRWLLEGRESQTY